MQASQTPSKLNLFQVLIAILLTIGFVTRVAPLFNFGGRLLRQFPTEDGYLMLTIARNLSLGRGMSTAAGTIPTNGTQPLFNFIEAFGFLLSGGNRFGGVAIALAIQVLVSLMAAAVLFVLALKVLERRTLNWQVAALATGVWYSSSIAIPHTMNCLETGFYTLMVLLTMLVWFKDETEFDRDQFSWGVIKIGGLMGLTFWARNDAAFMIAAITSTHTLVGFWQGRKQFIRRLVEAIVMGLTSIVVASPWLIYNKLNFGSIVPISGTAQSYFSVFGSNLSLAPIKLFEYLTVVLPIPMSLETNLLVILGTLAIVVLYFGLVALVAVHMTVHERTLLCAVAIMAGLLLVYYGLLFGAPHFLGRYLFPLSPFLALFTSAMVVYLVHQFSGIRWFRQLVPIAAVFLILLQVGLNARIYRLGTNHAHFQVVAWVKKNVSTQEWVGAVQTGTLGFFHDRTVNLDGKVNPQALEAKLAQSIPDYVNDKTFDDQGGRINYLADWVGIAQWSTLPPLDKTFEIIVKDPKKNLAVLKRKSA